MPISFEITDDSAIQALKGLRHKFKAESRRVMNRTIVAPYMKDVIRKNYAAQGRPSPWPPLALSTIARRVFRGNTGNILNSRSIDPTRRFSFSRMSPTEVRYGSSHRAVVWHDTPVRVTARTVTSRRGPMVFMTAGGQIIITHTARIAQPTSTNVKAPYTIPARPVIGMTRADAQELSEKVLNELISGWKNARST